MYAFLTYKTKFQKYKKIKKNNAIKINTFCWKQNYGSAVYILFLNCKEVLSTFY